MPANTVLLLSIEYFECMPGFAVTKLSKECLSFCFSVCMYSISSDYVEITFCKIIRPSPLVAIIVDYKSSC